MNDFRPAIRRALQRRCTFDFIGMFHTYPLPSPRAAREGSRLSWTRLNTLRRRSASGFLPSAAVLAKEFGCGVKTIHRDIETLRRNGLQITYVENRYRYEVSLKGGSEL